RPSLDAACESPAVMSVSFLFILFFQYRVIQGNRRGRPYPVWIVPYPAEPGRPQGSPLPYPNCALSVSFQSAGAFGVAFGDLEEVDAERNAHDSGNNQRPRIAPDFA